MRPENPGAREARGPSDWRLTGGSGRSRSGKPGAAVPPGRAPTRERGPGTAASALTRPTAAGSPGGSRAAPREVVQAIWVPSMPSSSPTSGRNGVGMGARRAASTRSGPKASEEARVRHRAATRGEPLAVRADELCVEACVSRRWQPGVRLAVQRLPRTGPRAPPGSRVRDIRGSGAHSPRDDPGPVPRFRSPRRPHGGRRGSSRRPRRSRASALPCRSRLRA
jgi:hypothetical protein